MPLIVRDSTENDLPAITAIYDYAVRHGTATFETEPPDIAEMTRRRKAVLESDHPYLVAETNGKAVGYSYAGLYHKRYAYRFSIENSIYIADDHQKQGIGHALLEALITRCEEKGYRIMVAMIGDSDNVSSIRLHAKHGFQHAGLLPAVGWKFNRWLDVVFMTRSLGKGATEPPVSG